MRIWFVSEGKSQQHDDNNKDVVLEGKKKKKRWSYNLEKENLDLKWKNEREEKQIERKGGVSKTQNYNFTLITIS